MKKILALSILAITSNLIFAQESQKKCITNRITQEALKKNPEYQIIRQNLINYHQENKDINKKDQSIITIPVVVHIVHRNSHPNIGSGTNISNEQIEDQLRILNEDYSKTNPEFPNPPRNTFINFAGNAEIQFCLASVDPNGNPTTGITRTSTSRTSWDADDNTDADAMKLTSSGGIHNWDPLRYLNIWVCNLTNSGGGITAGYAYLPGLQGSNQSWKDGPVVDFQYFGSIGAANTSDGRTTTHEIGHYLGLNHTFSENNWPSSSCLNNSGSTICCDRDNSNVDDTPPTDAVYFGSVTSNTNNNTCDDTQYGFNTDALDMDENYMSHASNTWMFSNGQVNAMLGTLNASTNQGGRRNLWQNSTVTVNCINATTNNLSESINLSIYPNPTKGDLSINTSEKIIAISIYNLIGVRVISGTETNKNKLNVKELSNGVYFIRINTEKGSITKRIIISK